MHMHISLLKALARCKMEISCYFIDLQEAIDVASFSFFFFYFFKKPFPFALFNSWQLNVSTIEILSFQTNTFQYI